MGTDTDAALSKKAYTSTPTVAPTAFTNSIYKGGSAVDIVEVRDSNADGASNNHGSAIPATPASPD